MTRVEHKALIEWLEQEVNGLGYELLDIEWIAGRGATLRLYIDAEAGIGIDDCEAVSRAVEALLDVRDAIPGAYRLEVSSPGAERPLRTSAHFAGVVGERIRLWIDEPGGAVQKFSGRLLEVGMDGLRLENAQTQRVVRMEDIVAARLVPANEKEIASGGRRSKRH